MTNYYFPIIYIVPLISVDGQASPRLFIAPEIRHEKISYTFKLETDYKLCNWVRRRFLFLFLLK